jgi:hypothetical protein
VVRPSAANTRTCAGASRAGSSGTAFVGSTAAAAADVTLAAAGTSSLSSGCLDSAARATAWAMICEREKHPSAHGAGQDEKKKTLSELPTRQTHSKLDFTLLLEAVIERGDCAGDGDIRIHGCPERASKARATRSARGGGCRRRWCGKEGQRFERGFEVVVVTTVFADLPNRHTVCGHDRDQPGHQLALARGKHGKNNRSEARSDGVQQRENLRFE